jgi:hypothetical protein
MTRRRLRSPLFCTTLASESRSIEREAGNLPLVLGAVPWCWDACIEELVNYNLGFV